MKYLLIIFITLAIALMIYYLIVGAYGLAVIWAFVVIVNSVNLIRNHL